MIFIIFYIDDLKNFLKLSVAFFEELIIDTFFLLNLKISNLNYFEHFADFLGYLMPMKIKIKNKFTFKFGRRF